MADRARTASRPLLLAAGGAAALVLLIGLRGPLVLFAVATVAVIAGFVLAVPPLLRHDGIDWDWLPHRGDEVPPEPGIATLRRLLSPTDSDTASAGELHDLVRAIADDRAQGRGLGDGPLVAYLDGPPRRLDLREVEALITALESLPTKES
ncbi:MAG TPA: hypothetical protein VFI44_13695 [Ornithinibacter sp.]|nr:hypothetical protein [Ornithinibacter sp.]